MDDTGFKVLALAIPILAGIIALFWKANSVTREAWLRQSLLDLKAQGEETKHEVKRIWPEINEINLKLASKNAQCMQHETAIKHLSYDMGALEKSLQTYHSRIKGAPVENFRNHQEKEK